MKDNGIAGSCFGLVIAGAVFTVVVAGCVVQPNGQVTLGYPVVVAPAPAPVIVAPVMVPEYYVWDGYEYVGVVGNQYVYLGPGNVWLIAEPFRLERFHGWERGHADWRMHATRNEQFRTDRNGHVQPRHDEARKDESRKDEPRKDERESH